MVALRVLEGRQHDDHRERRRRLVVHYVLLVLSGLRHSTGEHLLLKNFKNFLMKSLPFMKLFWNAYLEAASPKFLETLNIIVVYLFICTRNSQET